ncbi:methylenetetrahydrofolate reductase C-terminal domain-containing protein [Candidatus Omnitrophota bacterium]
MIISKQKAVENILKSLEGYNKIFLVGCGECATTCKSGGEEELALMQEELKKHGKSVVGSCIPDAPCVAAQIKTGLAKNMLALREAEAVLVFACGLGTQSVKENNRLDKVVLPGCDTLFGATVDAKGDFLEKCSMCAECVLDITGGICPITLCSKGLLNGPCGGTDQGKCEVDKDKDCAWVLIYKELDNRKQLEKIRKAQSPKNYKLTQKPRKLSLRCGDVDKTANT